MLHRTHNMTSSTMGSLVLPLLLAFLAASQLQGKASAHLDPDSGLEELKDLLGRLEDKLNAKGGEAELSQSLDYPDDETARDSSQNVANWEGNDAQAMGEGGFGRGNWPPPERSPSTLRRKLGALFNTRRNVQRSSSCFGQRLDRIGSSSGLGCNRKRN